MFFIYIYIYICIYIVGHIVQPSGLGNEAILVYTLVGKGTFLLIREALLWRPIYPASVLPLNIRNMNTEIYKHMYIYFHIYIYKK